MHASASQVAAPPRMRVPAWLLPIGAVAICSALALALGEAPAHGEVEPTRGTAPLHTESNAIGETDLERLEVRNDELVISGAVSVVARRLPLSRQQEGLSAAILVELSYQPGYEDWRRAHGRTLDDRLEVIRYEGGGRTFLRAGLSGPDLPAVDSLFEVRDGQLVRLDDSV